MKTKTILSTVFVLMLFRPGPSAAALSEAGLLELIEKGVSEELVVSIIECDCVDFTVDARTALRLDDLIPESILNAVLDCDEKRRGAGAQAAPPPPAPAPVPPPAPTAPAAVAAAAGVAAATTASGAAEAAEAYTLEEITRVALIPVALDGEYNKRMTKTLRRELNRKRTSFKLSGSFENLERPVSNEPLENLLQAGRAAGVEAVMVSKGAAYTVGGRPFVQLDAKLVEVNQGEILWAGEGTSPPRTQEDVLGGVDGSWHEARAAASKSVLLNLP